MLIAIDVGNTQTVMGLFDGEELLDQWRLSTVHDRTADEYRLYFEGLLRQDRWRVEDCDGVALSSVVPPVKEAMIDLAGQMVNGPLVVVGPGVRTGMSINIDNPRRWGPTGWSTPWPPCTATAPRSSAWTSAPPPTSTSWTPPGRTSGGHRPRAAGLRAGADQRHRRPAPRGVAGCPGPPSARNTVEAIQSGLLFGHAGMVDGIVERLRAEVGGDPKVVATGGLAPTIVPLCRTVSTVDDRLTLDGLRLIYDMNNRGAT